MGCGYCSAPDLTVTTCSCDKAQRYRAAKLKGGAKKHPNPTPIASASTVNDIPGGHVQRKSDHAHMHLENRVVHDVPKRIVVQKLGLPRAITTKVTAAQHNSARELVQTLMDAVRDKKIRVNKGDEVVKRDQQGTLSSSHCYYLRSKRPSVEVDHTFECQLMGHALVQTEAWYNLYKQEGFIDRKISRTGGLRQALDDVYHIQNSILNLHMLDEGINKSKRHVYSIYCEQSILFTTALNAMYASKRAGGIDLPHEMHNHCVRYCDSRADQFADGVDVGAKIASLLIKEFQGVERPITELMTGSLEIRGRSKESIRAQEKRMRALGESIVQLYEDLGC